MPGTGLDHFFPHLWQQSSLMGSLSFTSDTRASERLGNVMQVTAVQRHAPKASQFRVHFPHRPSADAPRAEPILTALGSSEDGISAQCDRCRTPCFKMDSRRSRKQHRGAKGELEGRDRQDNVCGQFFSGGFVWGSGDGTPGLLPARRAFPSELLPQPHKQYKRQSGGEHDST